MFFLCFESDKNVLRNQKSKIMCCKYDAREIQKSEETFCRNLKLIEDVPIAFSSPKVQPRVDLFWCQMKAYIFLIIIPKFWLQIQYTLEVIAENVPFSSIPIFIFLYVFS